MRVSPVNLKSLAYTLDVEGHDAAKVLEACGLPPFDELNEDGDWVPVSVCARMLDELVVAKMEPQ